MTLGVYYRDVDNDGVVYGGPMYYLKKGLKEEVLNGRKSCAVIFAICCIGGSLEVEMLHNLTLQL